MEILVNREPLDFSLETESSVGEVVDGLAEWLKSGRFAITSLDVNATTYALHDRTAWQDISLDDVNELSVEALPLSYVDHATLVAVDDYCSLLRECLETGTTGPLAELAAELPYVRKRIAQFFPSLSDDAETPTMLANAELDEGRMPEPGARANLIEEVDAIRTIVASREREYREPERELALTLGQLSGSRSTLIDVPVQLQTGKERAAMQTIVTLTELLSRLIRLIPIVESREDADIDTGGVRTFAEELVPFLAELREAFEVQDTVLIGDLLEYEIAPRLEQIEALVPGEIERG